MLRQAEKEEAQGWLMLALVVAVILMLCGCGTTTRTQTTDSSRITGTVAGAPVDVQVQRQVQEQSETKVQGPDLTAIAPLLPAIPVAGPVAGIAGAAFGLWRMLKEKAANKALTQTVAGIEDFKSQHEPEVVEKLHHSLGRKMDSDAKKRVKQARVHA